MHSIGWSRVTRGLETPCQFFWAGSGRVFEIARCRNGLAQKEPESLGIKRPDRWLETEPDPREPPLLRPAE
jgi:hypothetical protein